MKKLISILKFMFDPRELFKQENWVHGEQSGLKIRRKVFNSKSKSQKKKERHARNRAKGNRR